MSAQSPWPSSRKQTNAREDQGKRNPIHVGVNVN
jgi:hypothetical protein